MKQWPSVKQMPPGLEYHQFRDEYQKLLGNFHPNKIVFYAKYGAYCAYHKQKERQHEQQ